ncbi:hypothetical protein BGZ81_004955 [Podila clonocystis]|nr:hypothetical protein BGZ81_004955 [Podila clonocystis]
MSMVNRNLHAIVCSLEVWPRMFSAAYGTKAQLRTLLGIPRSKSYMIFLCSSSLHICEMCFNMTGYKADNLSKLPLPIPVLMPRQSTAAITADLLPEFNRIGRKNSIDEVTAIKHMRRLFGGDVGIKASMESTEVLDEKTETRIRWYQLQD